jgi:hypothetical protein
MAQGIPAISDHSVLSVTDGGSCHGLSFGADLPPNRQLSAYCENVGLIA